jgi:pimeloyl-ACP methyl ester carboxylesterase
MWLSLTVLVALVSRFVAVAPGESLSVAVSGSGPPVVLIPGLLGSGFTYRKITPLLQQAGFTSIVVEPLGVGASSRPPNADYSLAAQGARVAAVLDSLRVARAYWLAHSVGASIVLRIAVDHPDCVAGIVSLEGGVAEAATTPGFRRAMKLAPIIKLLGIEFVLAQTTRQMRESSGNPDWVTEEVVAGYLEAASRDLGASLKAYRGMARSVEPEPLAPRLDRIRAPLFLLLGGVPHDGAPSPEEIATLAQAIRHFAVDTIPGVGHFPHEEAPERVAAAVAQLHAGASARVAWLSLFQSR